MSSNDAESSSIAIRETPGSEEPHQVNKFPLVTKRLVLGNVAVCVGCCCGNTAKGKPAVPVEWLKKEWRARGLLKKIQLTISGCLGPCDIPNVVAISNERGTQWLGGITEFNQYRSLLEWAVSSVNAGELLLLPNQLQRCSIYPFQKPTLGTGLYLFARGSE
jgi:cobaltochelatase CobN